MSFRGPLGEVWYFKEIVLLLEDVLQAASFPQGLPAGDALYWGRGGKSAPNKGLLVTM